jgi:two-component system cell cycle sensor histidine kinase/response regulator CckA
LTTSEPPSKDDPPEARAELARLRSVLASPLLAIGFSDPAGKLIDANDTFLRLFAYDRGDLARLRWDDVVPSEYRQAQKTAVEQAQNEGAAAPFEAEYQTKDGRRLQVHVSVTGGPEPGSTAVVVLDISYRRRVEEQLLKAQRMEAVGRLAGGIAHDFNNLLCAITGYADLMRTQMKSEDHLRPHVNQVLEAADRAARLVRQLLAFSFSPSAGRTRSSPPSSISRRSCAIWLPCSAASSARRSSSRPISSRGSIGCGPTRASSSRWS